MKTEDIIIAAACIATMAIGAFAFTEAEGAENGGVYYLNGPVYVPPQTLPNYEGAGRTMILPNRPDVGSGSEAYYENRRRMAEAVRLVPEKDGYKILSHVIDNNGIMDTEGLRESGISDEAYDQLRDDAKLGY